MLFSEWNNKIQKVNPFKAFADLVRDNQTYFIDIMRAQMYSGKNGQGFGIGTYANKNYQKQKYSMNPTAKGLVDLHYTGAFYDGEFITVKYTTTSVTLKFYSRDPKADMLTKKYGVVIWEWNEESLLKSKEFILKEFKNYLL
jgi:hypothetical protein